MSVRIEPWGEGDLQLLEKLMGDPEMTEHLGGPESPAKIAERQTRYDRPGSGMFKIVDEATGEAVGSVGYWERSWRGEQVYEIGWSVIPAFQGRGIARTATSRAIALARSEGKHRFLHAFPSVDNPASNAICRKLDFTLVEECEFEYPRGSFMRCNDWRLDLRSALTGEAQLAIEFERQVANMRRLGYPQIAGISDDAFAKLLVSLRARLAGLPAGIAESGIPFVLVVDRSLVPPEKSMPLVEQDGRRGVVDMNPTEPRAFGPIETVEVPEGAAYLATDIDTGRETPNVTPDDALPLITAKGRSPLTIEEGIAVVTHHPGVLRLLNAFSLLGSRRGDKRVPALWTSKGSPRLGWCWAGNPHAWLGSASCASRLGA